MSIAIPVTPDIVYPDSDGKPMADNTLQFRYIVMIQGGLDTQFADDPNVFVAGDNLWYPVYGKPKVRKAPDVYVVFGRPKGDRGSYKQWEEDGIPLTVVFEVLSPKNTKAEMANKLRFYQRYGVEEYYVYDPDRGTLKGYGRRKKRLVAVADMRGFVSPRLQVRFELSPEGELRLYGPDGRPFDTFVETKQRADAEQQRADAEQQRADEQQQRADEQQQRAEALAALLRAHGIIPPQ